MTQPHGAIQTEYAGQLFRSRLEARWAVFFDAIGIKWKYETQGFEHAGMRYLPDFYLPDSRDWCEVKGDPEGLRSDFSRLRTILAPGGPLPGFGDGAALLVLGDLPVLAAGTVIHPRLHLNGDKLQRTWFFFMSNEKTGGKTVGLAPHPLLTLFGAKTPSDLLSNPESDGWSVCHHEVPTPNTWLIIPDAYRKARHSRFEHGQSGGHKV